MSKPIVRRMAGNLLDILVPCRCLHCFDTEPGSMHLGLCTRCRRKLEPQASLCRRACDLCGLVLHTPKAKALLRCASCMNKRSPLDQLFCAWRYKEPLNAVIHGLKFQDLSYLGRHLACELDRLLPPKLQVDAIVPVPLHWRRLWTRGYNQGTEIARPLALRRGWRLEEVLVRRRSTVPQTGLDRAARRRNLHRAFIPRHHRGAFELWGKHLLLVDDVYTTGATIEAAALALRSAGATWVGAAVAGRTPDPEH